MRHSFVILAAVSAWLGTGSAAPTGAAPSRTQVPRDSAMAIAAVEAVRGANPLLCDLAARSFEGRNGGWYSGIDLAAAGDESGNTTGAREIARWLSGGLRNARGIVAPLTARLSDPDACVRRTAATLLGRNHSDQAVDALLRALESGDAGARRAATLGLGFAESQRSVQPLGRSLRDSDAGVRAGSAWALGAIESRTAVPALVDAMKDADSRVRRNAAWALGNIEDASAVPALTTALRDDRDPEVRRVAAWALGNVK